MKSRAGVSDDGVSDDNGLFGPQDDEHRPLAARMRPRSLEDFAGQEHLLAPGRPLRLALDEGTPHSMPHSMVLWGPPGSGKTTLAWIASRACSAAFIPVSAVSAGVKDIRDAVEQARKNRAAEGRSTILFIDEVHRFNKAQQDAFLSHVEDGTITFIGATTENPSFELNNALLSRVRVYVLKPLETGDLVALLDKALTNDKRLAGMRLEVNDECKRLIAETADGDARKALNLLEICADLAVGDAGVLRITEDVVRLASAQSLRRFDKGGDLFYDQISAFHKSVRGSDPDAALYWLARMLDGGCDPLYVARRMVRITSEDVGNANLRAWEVTLNAWMTYERLGSPEGELALAHAAVYLACSPKSDAVYVAFKAAFADARKSGTLEVPMHLRNAPTKLMKELGHGKGYRHAHDEEGAFAAGENYFPDRLAGSRYYEPTDRGAEAALGEHLKRLREWNRRERKRAGRRGE